MKTSAHGIDMLCSFEGVVLRVYLDQAGIPTVGVGHRLTDQEIANHVFAGGITRDEATGLMQRDLERFEESINRTVKVPLGQHQFDALVCFSYNVGTGAFESSSLVQRLNSGHYDEVPAQLLRWCHRRDPRTGQMVEDAGLLKRRQCEAAIWRTPDDAEPECPVVTDEDRERVRGLVALSLAELSREDFGARDLSDEGVA